MQIPDLQQYKDKFSQEAFTDKIARIAKRREASWSMLPGALLHFAERQCLVEGQGRHRWCTGLFDFLPSMIIPDAIPLPDSPTISLCSSM